MKKINKILNYGLLAELAYLKLEDTNFDNYKQKNITNFLKGLDKFGNKKVNSKNISLTDEEISQQTNIQSDRVNTMINLLDRYTIKDFSSDDGWVGSDFQGMLLQDNHTGKYIIAFRGTSSIKDALVDLAIAKITMNHNFQYNEAIEFVKLMKRKHGIEKDNLILTGHSLGGILAQSIGVHMKIKAFAYNPLGICTIGKGTILSLNIIFYPYSSLYKKNISSFSSLNSNNIFFKSLDYEENLLFTDKIIDKRMVA